MLLPAFSLTDCQSLLLPCASMHVPTPLAPRPCLPSAHPSSLAPQTCYAYPKSDVTIKTHAEEEMLGM